MYKSDLFLVFSSLSPSEKRVFSKFLNSPFFNQKQKTLDLWDYLLKNAKFGAPAFKKEKVFESLFLGEPYTDKEMRHIMSWLLKAIEQFLAYSEYKSTPGTETLYLARAYKNRKLGKLFQKSIRRTETQLSKTQQGQDYFYNSYLVEFEKYEFAESLQRSSENNLREMNVALDKHLLISKLKQACLLRSHQSVFKTDYDFTLVELLLDFIKTSVYKNDPTIAAFHNCYLALNKEDESAFQNLKETIKHKSVLFSSKDLRILYLFSMNFAIRKLNTGDPAYPREAFELYRFGLVNDILIVDNVLSHFAYNNIVSIGLKLKEFDWLEHFIEQYKLLILPRYRESYFTYNRARIFFTKRDYTNAMKLLHQVDERDLLLNLDAKVMLLKLYFELDEYDALSSLLASFKVMLTRKKLLSYHKTHYSNIIKFTNRLLHLKPRDQKAHDKLAHDIRAAEMLQEKEWLLEQLGMVK